MRLLPRTSAYRDRSGFFALRTMRSTFAVLLCIVSGQVLSGQATSSPTPITTVAASTGDPTLHSRNPRYTLRRGDTFDVDFALSPEFNQSLAVQPDGYVTLKSVGSLMVEGKTVPELTEALKSAYKDILHDPVISISLKEFERPYFIASGQVSKPGKYELRSSMTVTQAVAIAGGFNDSAKYSQVVLFRPTANGMFEAKLLDVKKLLATRDLSEDIRIEPGDTIYVPQTTISKIRKYLPNTSLGAMATPAY